MPDRIGPNAIRQVLSAVDRRHGPRARRALLVEAGLPQYLEVEPSTMVDEGEVLALHQGVAERFSPALARAVMTEAGAATAEYLLANRIPKAVQWWLRALPAALSSRWLSAAIARHAWTFTGSGRFSVASDAYVSITIDDNPLCPPGRAAEPRCDYHAATFERLFQRLVAPAALAREVECRSAGGQCCRFEVRWR